MAQVGGKDEYLVTYVVSGFAEYGPVTLNTFWTGGLTKAELTTLHRTLCEDARKEYAAYVKVAITNMQKLDRS